MCVVAIKQIKMAYRGAITTKILPAGGHSDKMLGQVGGFFFS